jgi:hypothetical protein
MFSPGAQSEFAFGAGLSWDYHLAKIREWLRNLRREVAVVDPWLEIGSLDSSSLPEPVDSDGPFAPKEIGIIHSQLDSVAAEIERLQIGSAADARP